MLTLDVSKYRLEGITITQALHITDSNIRFVRFFFVAVSEQLDFLCDA